MIHTSSFVRRASGLCLFLSAVAAQGQETADFARTMTDKGPALVTIKCVLKMSMGPMGEQESESETAGVMIDGRGLVLASNTQIGGMTSLMRRFMRGADVTATPTDIKVLVGDDNEGVEAAIIARDSELDLAWVRIKKPPEKPYAFVDIRNGAKVKIGDRLVVVRRLGKYFDRALVGGAAHVGGVTSKPRELIVPSESMGSLGSPVFAPSGALVGVTIMQLPDELDASMAGMMRSQEGMGMILPAEVVARATGRALESEGSGETQAADGEKKSGTGEANKDAERKP